MRLSLPPYIKKFFYPDNTKKKLCIVHIGMPKTGSSALQISFFSGIDDPDVCYANLPVASHGPIIFSMCAHRPERHYSHRNRRSSLAQVEAENSKHKQLLIESFTNKETTTEIISGEDIFHLGKPGLINLRNFLDKYFSEIIIVGYVRPPKSFMQSAFQQFVKFHNMKDFNFTKIYPHYRKKLEKFDHIFGKKNVKLWKYDPSRFPDGDITQDFCAKMNIHFNKDRKLRWNDTVSKEVISLLFLYNKFGKQIETSDMHSLNYSLIELLRPIGKSKFTFSNKLMRTISSKYNEDIQWIENRIGEQLHDLGNEDPNAVNSEEELCKISSSICSELKKLLSVHNIQADSFDCKQKDIVEMLYLLKWELACKLNLLKLD